MHNCNENIIKAITAFLQSIGINVLFDVIDAAQCFVPGIKIINGCLLLDLKNLKYPGDILHEAGHIAVATPGDRVQLNGILEMNTDKAAGEEMMALAWSYAAAIHLNINPQIVFHANGYNGGGIQLIDSYENGNGCGVPMLAWIGLTNAKSDKLIKTECFPHMIKWIR